MELVLILVAAVLYRIPRGGPDEDTWYRWLGKAAWYRPPGSMVWAVCLSGAAVVWGFPGAWAPVLAIALWLGEKPGYSQRWRGETIGDVLRMSARGVLLFNPLFGVIYALAYRARAWLPRRGQFLDGWTAWAELASGLVTATVIYLLTKAIF